MIDISKSSQTTIIITTHYIEEARKANKVGLIRNGKILAENSPEYLLQIYSEIVKKFQKFSFNKNFYFIRALRMYF